MSSFDQTLEHIALYFEQVEGTLILIGVCDDVVLREHAVNELRKRLPQGLTLRDFHYDPDHLSLLEGAIETTTSNNGHVAVSVTGFEVLPRDKRTEAIKLLNWQRNRFGHTNIAVLLWVDRATLTEISTKAADFYSWRSGTFIIEPPSDWDTLASARRSYLQALVTQNEFVNLQGLAPARGGHIVQMRMEDIFIPLQTEPEQERGHLSNVMMTFTFPEGPVTVHFIEGAAEIVTATEGAGKYAVELLGNPPHVLKVTGPTGMQTVNLQAVGQSDRKTGPAEIPDLLQARRAVVLGDPGAGKTTLLRYLAYTVAQAQLTQTQAEVLKQQPDLQTCLPVYIRVGEYAQHLQHHPTTAIEDYAPHGCQAQQLPLSEELLKTTLAHDQIVFLLDGLDEVIATDFRRVVAEQLAALARRHPQCRILVTSRIVGYREAQLGSEFAQFTIRPFDDPEIQRFAHSWYAALHEPENSAEQLGAAITGNASVRRLASNPLLLTVIALIHWRGTKLPQYRAKLYSQAAETLVDQWMSYRRVNPEGWDVQETLQTLLPAIAWHMHVTTSSGLIGEHELHDLLVTTLQHHNLRLSEQDAHSRASQFRRNVNEFSGIFLERGLDQDGRGLYGFLHLTFEEYFAAVQLAEQWQRDGQRVLKPLLHNPRWTEVLLLAVGHLGDFSPYLSTQFVKNILKAKSDYENILHRDLLLVTCCLAEDVPVDVQVRRTIMSKLIKLHFDEKSPRALREDIWRLFAPLGSASVGGELLGLLTERFFNSDAFVRAMATWAVEQLGGIAATPEVMSSLHRSLTDPVWFVREAAADAIGRLGQELVTSEVVSDLLNLLGHPKSTLRIAAARTIGKLGQKVATPAVLATLLENLTSPVWEVRDGAASALRQLGQLVVSPSIVSTLLNLLSSPDMHIRGTAATLLGDLAQGIATAEVLTILLKHLTDPNSYVRGTIARVLDRLVREEEKLKVIETLLGYLHSPDRQLHEAATDVFGQMGQWVATPEVLSVLLKLLDDPDWEIRRTTADTIGKIGSAAAQPEIIGKLLRTLTDPEGIMRRTVAVALGQMGQMGATAEILCALLKLLDDPEEYVRTATVEAVGKLAQFGPTTMTAKVVTRLLTCLDDLGRYVRSAAAQALGQLGAAAATAEVLNVLVASLRDTDGYVRSAAAQALQQLSVFPQQDRSQVVQLVLSLATSRDAELRNTGYVCLRNILAGEQGGVVLEG